MIGYFLCLPIIAHYVHVIFFIMHSTVVASVENAMTFSFIKIQPVYVWQDVSVDLFYIPLLSQRDNIIYYVAPHLLWLAYRPRFLGCRGGWDCILYDVLKSLWREIV